MHVCKLHKKSDSHILQLPPNARFYIRLKRRFQKLIIVWINHPLTPFLLRSQLAVAAEKKRHGRGRYWWVIHPYSVGRYAWDAVMAVNFLYLFFTLPYVVAFHRISAHKDFKHMHIIYPAQVICLLDIFLNLITGFVSTDGHSIFLEPMHIMRHYVKGYFIVDVISTIPFNIIYKDCVEPPGPNSDPFFICFECLPLLKFVRLITLRQYIKQLCTTYGSSSAQDITIWLVILTVLILHWSSCISYAFPYIIMHLEKNSMEHSKTYLSETKLYIKPTWKIYLTCLHIGISNLVGSSFIEFSFSGILDKIIRCIILISGRGCLIYLIVIVLQLVTSTAESEIKYQEKMHQVKEYIYDRRLPDYLQEKLISYYEYRFQGNYFKENLISSTLSRYLNQEAIMHSSLELLETATVFHNLPRNQLASLMAVLKPCIYITNDIIYKAETKGGSMYFIVSGTVTLITISGKEICHLHDGGHFGETTLVFPEQKYLETVIALEVCELLRLDHHDFKQFVFTETSLYHQLQAIALQTQEAINAVNNVLVANKHQ